MFTLTSILIIRLGLKLLKLSLILGRIVGGCVQLSIIDHRLLFLDYPLVRSLLSLLRDTLGKIWFEFVLVGQKTSIVTMWWLVHASCRDIKWLECSVDDLPSWLSRIVVLGLCVRIVHDIVFNLFLALSLQSYDIGCHLDHSIWVWCYRNTVVIIVLGLLKQTEKRPFILLQFFKLIQFSFHAIEILIHKIIDVFDLHWLFQLYFLSVSLLHHFLV